MNIQAPSIADTVDLRLACMSLVAADLILVEAGELDLEAAFEDMVSDIEDIIDADFIKPTQRSPDDRHRHPTPQVVIEAIKHSVRDRGLAALKEPTTIERLSRCDEAARRRINEWIAARFPGASA
jgi:hypothetical protein